jgi:hypothetical protein
MSIDFASIPNLISGELKCLYSLLGNSIKIRQYSGSGGIQTARSWNTAGLYTQENSNSRFVLEVLSVPSKNICVVRIYHDEPLEILFARKLMNGLDALPEVLHNASDVFSNALRLLLTKNNIDLKGMVDEMSLSVDHNKLLTQALSPVPPPCNLNEIEAA